MSIEKSDPPEDPTDIPPEFLPILAVYEKLRQDYFSEGDGDAFISCVELCVHGGLPLPHWIAVAIQTAKKKAAAEIAQGGKKNRKARSYETVLFHHLAHPQSPKRGRSSSSRKRKVAKMHSETIAALVIELKKRGYKGEKLITKLTVAIKRTGISREHSTLGSEIKKLKASDQTPPQFMQLVEELLKDA